MQHSPRVGKKLPQVIDELSRNKNEGFIRTLAMGLKKDK